MDANVVTRDKSAVIQLNGRFDFNAHREFRNAMERALGLQGIDARQYSLGIPTPANGCEAAVGRSAAGRADGVLSRLFDLQSLSSRAAAVLSAVLPARILKDAGVAPTSFKEIPSGCRKYCICQTSAHALMPDSDQGKCR